jgi:hypothetical protein
MKKYFVFSGIVIAAIVFANCNSAKKTTAAEAPKSTYASHITSAVTTYCTPCHIPAKGGNKKAYDNFANVKADIDEIIRRIELNPGDRGYMPFKKAKLSDSTIAVFKQWKADGMLEN